MVCYSGFIRETNGWLWLLGDKILPPGRVAVLALRAMEGAGFAFRVDGGTLYVSPADRIPPNDRELIKELTYLLGMDPNEASAADNLNDCIERVTELQRKVSAVLAKLELSDPEQLRVSAVTRYSAHGGEFDT